MTAPGLFELVPAPADHKELPEPASPYYVVDQEGFLVNKQTRLGPVLVRVENGPKTLPKYDFNGSFTERIPPFPAELMSQVHGFFAHTLKTHKSEAMVLLFLNDEDKWSIEVPPQKVSHTSIAYDLTDYPLPADAKLVGTIHSHCDFSAFHSGTDETDAAKHDGVHITIGHVDKDTAEYDVMVAFNGVLWKGTYNLSLIGLKAEDIKPTPFPLPWSEQITAEKPYTPNWTMGTNDGWEMGKGWNKKDPRPKWNDWWDQEEEALDDYFNQSNAANRRMPGSQINPSYFTYNNKDEMLLELSADLTELRRAAERGGLKLTYQLTKGIEKKRTQDPEGNCEACGMVTWLKRRQGVLICSRCWPMADIEPPEALATMLTKPSNGCRLCLNKTPNPICDECIGEGWTLEDDTVVKGSHPHDPETKGVALLPMG